MTEAPTDQASTTVRSRNPATGEIWAEFGSADKAAVDEAVERSRGAQEGWRMLPPVERARVLERFRQLVVERRISIAGTIADETGKSATEAFFEIFGAVEFARYYARLAPRALAPRRWRSSNLAIWRKTILTEMEPYGVVAAITPWNYPFLLSSGLVIPALAAGNGVILKPSELTPSCGALLAQLMTDAGLPEDLLQVTQGAGETGASLVNSNVDKIFFIGSEATGRKIAAAASRTMTPYVLELGGSDPAIVLEDAHLKTAAEGITWGRFTNAGQTCVAPKRVFVVDEVYDEFLGHLNAAVRRLDEQEQSAVGPPISLGQKHQLQLQLDDALDRGARVASRGSGREDEFHFPPTVLVDVTPDMKVIEEETFGPLLPIVRVRDAAEAVDQANASRYGLSASIWSRDVARATELARSIEAGTVSINDSVIVALIADMPYGGIKSSGTGHTHGEAGLMECVRTRSTIIDRFSRFRESYWHYYRGNVQEGLDAFLVFTHGRGLFRRLGAGVKAVWLLYIKP